MVLGQVVQVVNNVTDWQQKDDGPETNKNVRLVTLGIKSKERNFTLDEGIKGQGPMRMSNGQARSMISKWWLRAGRLHGAGWQQEELWYTPYS